MSFFSSLQFFHPGRPPLVTVGHLRSFCDALRQRRGLRDSLLYVHLGYGRPSQAAFDATHSLTWNAAGSLATRPLNDDDDEDDNGPTPDHVGDGPGSWSELWPGERSRVASLFSKVKRADQTVHLAQIGLGTLTPEEWAQLGARDPNDPYSCSAPDSMGLSIGPFRANTLRTEPPEEPIERFQGGFAVCFVGNGYFTWQPLARYWEAIRQTPVVQETLHQCREHFPVPAAFTREVIAEALGEEPFLNADEYRAGDWVVTLRESG